MFSKILKIPNRKQINNFWKEKGFTLIELLVVISIISLISSVLLVSLQSVREKARIARAQTDLNAMRQAMTMYISQKGDYPTPCAHCFDPVTDPNTCNCFVNAILNQLRYNYPYVVVPIKDPWGTCYIYHYHSCGSDPESDPITGEFNFIMSLGPNKNGDWAAEFTGTCDDDDICVFFDRGRQRW